MLLTLQNLKIMTDVLELFSGIGVIIDDAFGREEDDIIKDIKII